MHFFLTDYIVGDKEQVSWFATITGKLVVIIVGGVILIVILVVLVARRIK